MNGDQGKYLMRVELAKTFAAACCLSLLAVTMQASQATAAEVLPTESSISSISDKVQNTTESNQEGGKNSVQLTGGVSVFQPHSLIGLWNGHIKRFGRHPKLKIDYCQDGQIAGTYKGIFGTFPVTGQYEEATGNITIHVDFSSSRLARLKRLRSGHGLIEANIQNDILIGQASIPDLGPKKLRWEAVKDFKDVMPSRNHP